MWLKQNGQIEAEDFRKTGGTDKESPIDCDEDSCRYQLLPQKAVFAFTATGLKQACSSHAPLLLNLTPIPSPCILPFSLDLNDLTRNGTHMLFVKKNGVESISVGGTRGNRLWSGYY
jgi:hypothetical protein